MLVKVAGNGLDVPAFLLKGRSQTYFRLRICSLNRDLGSKGGSTSSPIPFAGSPSREGVRGLSVTQLVAISHNLAGH